MGAAVLPLGGLEASDIFHAHAGPSQQQHPHHKVTVSWHSLIQLLFKVSTRHSSLHNPLQVMLPEYCLGICSKLLTFDNLSTVRDVIRLDGLQ